MVSHLRRLCTNTLQLPVHQVTGFYSCNLNGESFPPAITIKSASKKAPNVFISLCQHLQGTEYEGKGRPCDCKW